MKKYYVLDDEATALVVSAQAFDAHMKEEPDGPYKENTTKWATPRQRLDGKWIIPHCEHLGDLNHVVETFEPTWLTTTPDEL